MDSRFRGNDVVFMLTFDTMSEPVRHTRLSGLEPLAIQPRCAAPPELPVVDAGGVARSVRASLFAVIPAEAGIHFGFAGSTARWIPGFAGTTSAGI